MGLSFSFFLFITIMSFFLLLNSMSLKDKEGGDGFVDPKVTDLEGPAHLLKGPLSLGLVYVFVIINDMLLFHLCHHNASVICYCSYYCYY